LAGITTGIIALKFVTAGGPVLALGFPPRLAVLVGLGLAQVGEFSFVLLREGEKLALIPAERYQMFLAAAVLTMMITPGMIAIAPRISHRLGQKGRRRDRLGLDEQTAQLHDHVIICGYGLNGRRLARLLRENRLPYLVIEMNSAIVRSARMEGENIYFGDVSNYEILKHAGAARARGIVFAISDPAILPRAISNARIANPDLHIIARIKRIEDARELRLAGATDVIAEELEAWMEIVTRILRLYGMPREVVAQQIATLREGDYQMLRILPIPGQPLRHLAHLLPQVELDLFYVLPDSRLCGTDLRTVNLRSRTGANVLAVVRESEVVHNPPGSLRFEEGDQVLLMGSREQLAAAFELLNQPRLGAQPHDAWNPS
jgi:CPA2 family monovalent cation:H+ antiporter-2